MHLGIDVGGTFTDGVIISKHDVINSVKVRTESDLSQSILATVQKLLQNIDPAEIRQIVLSTTLITNLLAQKKYEEIGLLLIPGPGVAPDSFNYPGPYHILTGAVDYRGRIIEDLKKDEINEAIKRLIKQGVTKIGVSCKFSQRNSELEQKVVEYLKNNYTDIDVLPSHHVSGLLNWIRRTNGTYFTLATRDEYKRFIEQISISLTKMGLECPVYILKADGGTLPLDISLNYPLEVIFSGPAASTLGALASLHENTTCVVMDMGGTTTDLALILNGIPLLADKGAQIDSYPIPVRALAVSSLALGGDTPLFNIHGDLLFGERQGPALCLGGPRLTITDIMVFEGICCLAAPDTITDEVTRLASELNMSPLDLVNKVHDGIFSCLETNLEMMFKRWEEEPAYHIWQLLSPRKERPNTLVCLGGPAKSVGSLWADKRGWDVIVPSYAPVANAVGAAMARTTLRLDLTADTERMLYSTNIGGLQGKLKKCLSGIEDAKAFANQLFEETKKCWNIEDTPTEELYAESFNVVRGWNTVGKIFQIGLQTKPGLVSYIGKGEM